MRHHWVSAVAAAIVMGSVPGSNYDHGLNMSRLVLSTAMASDSQGILGRQLGRAAWAGDLKTVRHLLALGISPDTTDDARNTPLMRAALGGHILVGRVLIKSGANINLKTPKV
jgi:ankyrin repeat protein